MPGQHHRTMGKFYALDAAALPDELFTDETPVEKWLERVKETDDEAGFEVGSLGSKAKEHPLESWVYRERIFGAHTSTSRRRHTSSHLQEPLSTWH